MGALAAHSEVRHRTMMSSKPTGTYLPVKTAKPASRLPSGQSVKIFRPSVTGLKKRVNNMQQDLPVKPDVSEPTPSTFSGETRTVQSTPQVRAVSHSDSDPSTEASTSTNSPTIETPAPAFTSVPTIPLVKTPAREVDGAQVTQEFLRTNEEYQKSKDRSPQTIFSLTLAWLLRHTARDFGYRVVPDGFMRVSDVLRFFKNETLESFSKRCLNDPMQRFEILSLPDLIDGRLQDVWWVKARYGQTIPGVLTSNKRVLNMGRLQTVVYRTTMDEWPEIQKYGIREGPEHTIPLLHRSKNFFRNHVPQHKKYLCITIDAERAAAMGVMFFYTNNVDLLAVGNRDRVIPLAACRSVIELDISKESLR